MSPEMAVPKDHPIRPIKKYVDEVLKDLSPLFDEMYAELGRPSIPPERLLKCKVLMALFTVRSEHFSVDGTLIEAWASLKSFRPKDENDDGLGGGSNRWVDFHGEKRRNETHQSRTDKEARLLRKGRGREAKLCFGAHALMENRNGLCLDLKVTSSTETTEVVAALEMLDEQDEIHDRQPSSLGGGKNYHTKAFVNGCRERGAKPHVATIKNRRTPGLDGRTLSSRGYETSQRIRKRIEEIFGWMKTVGGFRKTRYRGIERTQQSGWLVAAAYNLVRMAKLGSSPPAVIAPA